jgi:predicted outer membrane repeat protein
VTNSTFSGNSANEGGGIANFGSAQVRNSTFSGNSVEFEFGAGSGNGGGIANISTLELSNSTFSDNRADSGGGGIASVRNSFMVEGPGNLEVRNSTFSGNSAHEGGGIHVEGERTVALNSTFSGNTADIGGGIYSGGPVTLSNTIVADSSQGDNCNTFFPPVRITDNGYNVDDDGSCNLTQATGSLPNTDPLLDPEGLQNNGGPTKTIALLPDSPAVDLVAQGACPPPQTDQRGVKRPQGAACDSGAYELVQGPQCTIKGTPGDDFLKGTSGNDFICGKGGNDIVIDYKGGNDTLFGDGGKDILLDVKGKGFLRGGDGNDVLFTLDDAPLDTMDGQSGNDFCLGDKGDVRVNCERGSLLSLSGEESKRLDEAKNAAGLYSRVHDH